MALGSAISGWLADTRSLMQQKQQQRQQQVAPNTTPLSQGGAASDFARYAQKDVTPPPSKGSVHPSVQGPLAPGVGYSATPPANQTPWRPGHSPAQQEWYSQRNQAQVNDQAAHNQRLASMMGNWADTRFGPQLADWASDQHRIRQQYGFSQQGQALDRRDLHDQYAQGVANVQLGERGLGLDREELGLDRRGNQVSRDYIGHVRSIADRALQSAIGGYERDATMDQRDATSGYTARGAFFAPFHKQDLDHIAAQRDQRITDARLGREQSEAGWNRDMANLGLSDERIGIAERRLDLDAQRFGLQRKDYERMLNSGLARIGLQGQIDAAQLAWMLESGDRELASIAAEIQNYAATADPQVVARIMQQQANALSGG